MMTKSKSNNNVKLKTLGHIYYISVLFICIYLTHDVDGPFVLVVVILKDHHIKNRNSDTHRRWNHRGWNMPAVMLWYNEVSTLRFLSQPPHREFELVRGGSECETTSFYLSHRRTHHIYRWNNTHHIFIVLLFSLFIQQLTITGCLDLWQTGISQRKSRAPSFWWCRDLDTDTESTPPSSGGSGTLCFREMLHILLCILWNTVHTAARQWTSFTEQMHQTVWKPCIS